MKLMYVGLLSAVLPSLAVCGLTACSSPSAEEVAGVGTVNLHLTGVSSGGVTYRLRNGQFAVSGTSEATFSTEEDPDAQSVQVELAAGNYLIELEAGWEMEREVDGIFEPVEAILTSDNPAPFAITDQEITSVNFAFRAGDDIIELGNGILEVSISVEDDSCPTGTSSCTGVCADLQTSPDHCGACGHDCGGGECQAGVCQPFTLATGQGTVGQLGVNDTHVYWMDGAGGGVVRRVSKDGGVLESIATNVSVGTAMPSPALALSSEHVFWETPDVIRRAELDGTGAFNFQVVGGTVDVLLVREDRLFWNERGLGPTSIFSQAENGAAVMEISYGVPISLFTEAGGCLYLRVQQSGSSLQRFCPGQLPIEIAVSSTPFTLSPDYPDDGENFYFGVPGAGIRAVAFGSTTPTAITSGQTVRGPVVDGDVIYYIDGDTGGVPACTPNWSVRRVSTTPGSTPVTLVPAPMACPNSLTMDEDALYWYESDDDVIVKMVKPLP